MSSSTATASAFSIFAITCAVEPEASISVLSACTSDAERTNESATKSTAELERELEVVDVLPCQRRDRERDAGQVDALVRDDRAADEYFTAGSAPFDVEDPELDRAVVDEDVEPWRRKEPSTPARL